MKSPNDLSTIAKKLGQCGGKKTAELHGKKHFSKAGKLTVTGISRKGVPRG